MVRLGQVNVDDFIACCVRAEARNRGVDEWLAMGIVSAESNFDPRALGDGGLSFGLLQLYTAGGQGSDYAGRGELLFEPKLNLRIGMDAIATATIYARSQGWQGERFIREVARRSGHPGFVDIADARLTRIFKATVALITNFGGRIVAWPPFNPAVCAGAPAPPPPLGAWSEGPAPTTADAAFSTIERHAQRIDELAGQFG